MSARTRGFTLIELLVVIAIIGMLSSIVIASVNTARSKAKDATIKSEMLQLANLAELNYSDYGTYQQLQSGGWVSWNSPTCDAAFSGTYAVQAAQVCKVIIANANPNNINGAQYLFYASNSLGYATYSFMAALNSGGFFCIGSSGARAEYANYASQPGCWNNP